MPSYPLSKPAWGRHATARTAAGWVALGDGRAVQSHQENGAGFVYVSEEPPLTPEEEEALAARVAGPVVQDALF